MKLGKFTVIIFSVVLLSLGFILVPIFKLNVRPIDTVLINDIVGNCSVNWDTEDLSFLDTYDIKFTVMSNIDQILYQTSDKKPQSIYDGIKNGDIIVDIYNSSGGLLGKLMVENPTTQQIDEVRGSLVCYSVAFTAVILIIIIFYFNYVQRKILNPFSKLKNFSANIARGNFESPLPMDKKNVFGSFTESFDLMREELFKAREKERFLNQSKKELVASLSHDIKTPIASIIAVAEVLLVKVNTKEEVKKLNTIITKAEQIDSLISNMFHATLEELQTLSVTLNEVDSNRILQMFIDSDYKKLIQLSEVPKCVVLCDELRLQQVIDNVINNSYKYAGTTIQIEVNLHLNQFVFIIRDFGNGILEEELPLIFSKFYRGKNSCGKHGAGLGLYISNYLITQMGGTIAGSNLLNGFQVVVTLPLA